MAFDDFLRDGQTDAGAGQFPAVQAFKSPENYTRILVIETDAMICDRNDPFTVPLLASNVDPRSLVGFPVFQ